MSLRGRLAEVQLAVMMLTRLPAGRITGDAPDLSAARWAFPFVGLLIGGLTWAAHAAVTAVGLPPMVSAGVALAVLALATGALHFDGLADYADGIGGGRDKAHALEIMRDSRVGSYGVLAVILVSLLWVGSVAAAAPDLWEFLFAAVLSRAAIVVVQEALPLARNDGMAQLASGRSTTARIVVAVFAAAALVVWPVQLGVCALVAALIAIQAKRKIGGQTGDVLGAVQFLTETAIWITFASDLFG
ncbi:MAG: adenosylcobinamide-GDP ribazoletransferase [Pseudomonadota bacterium]|nr:adenosylcobinamide-GDP ribazoletransferase [Pseudomonadota bacterium]